MDIYIVKYDLRTPKIINKGHQNPCCAMKKHHILELPGDNKPYRRTRG